MAERPQVGVGAVVVRGGRVLLGYRLSAHDTGVWSACGGHMEPGESPQQTASRELREECGLLVPPSAWTLAAVTNDLFPESGKHYVTLSYIAAVAEGEPELTEPDKWREWGWYDPDDLPRPLMRSLRNALGAGLTFDPEPRIVVTN